ncbi:type II toxin-antitoxin system RelE family toxin [Enterococcus sp. AZ109]|uniref:type II toxin-antitoxin system RelE family toxin n=1 Tax=Enterococcus sp. AZ109 TaxID=2774634 RepID=UPI003F24C35A
MRYEIKLTKSSKRDLARLDNSQKDQLLKSFVKIEQNGLSAGQQLHGNLKDCRKLKHKKLELRVIFRESEIGIEMIEIVVVGKCVGNEVYPLAEKRLGR